MYQKFARFGAELNVLSAYASSDEYRCVRLDRGRTTHSHQRHCAIESASANAHAQHSSNQGHSTPNGRGGPAHSPGKSPAKKHA
jgi:hypothetical protein